MYFQAGNITNGANSGSGNAAAPTWDLQRNKNGKNPTNRTHRQRAEGGGGGMAMPDGLDSGGLNMGSIVGSDGHHPLSGVGESSKQSQSGNTGHAQIRGQQNYSQQQQKQGGGQSDENTSSNSQHQQMVGNANGTGLQPLRVPAINVGRLGGSVLNGTQGVGQGGGSSGTGTSPRGQQQSGNGGYGQSGMHHMQQQQQQAQQHVQQLQLQQQQMNGVNGQQQQLQGGGQMTQQQLTQQQMQMQQQQQQQQQQLQLSRDVSGRRNRGTRHGNTRGRRQKTNVSNGGGADGANNNGQMSQQNSLSGGTSQVQGNNSMFNTQGQGQGQAQGGGRESGLPQLVNSHSGGHASRRQPQQQGQGQNGGQQQQQQNGLAGVARESLPSYIEEHQWAATTSIKGLKPGNPNWINQDNFFIIEKFDNRDINFYCVLDGHGENGHHVSRHCRSAFPQHIRASNLDMKRAFNLMQNDLNSCEFDVRCSGATCVLAALCGARLSVSNCGDSRAVLGRRNPNGSVTAHALTQDHKPDKPEERKRILACGGHLGCRQVVVNQPGRGPVSMPVGPCRVWYQNRGETLGLAMSRSLGDSIVHRSGVSAEPETLEHIVDEYDEFMIIATDGVWDVIDNNQAVQMVQNFSTKSPKWNALDASNTICKFARSRWEKLSPMVDDITCIVVKLQRR